MAGGISRVRLFRAVSPVSAPIADSTHSISEISFLVCQLDGDTKAHGQSYLLSFHYSPNGILGAVRDVIPLLAGSVASDIGFFKKRFESEAEYFGVGGLQRQAFALLEVAMWDLWARTLDTPIWKLFGTTHRRVPVYGSGGWLSYTVEELVAEAKSYKQRGFTAVKVKVGSSDLRQDVERVAKVREAVGESVEIMVDANQGLDVPAAVAVASELEPYRVKWFEEPVANTDYQGYQSVRSQTRTAVAMGEREYDTVTLRELLKLNAIDLWQPDLIRIGGVDEWRKSSALAEAYNIPILPHYYKDYDVPLLCTVPHPYAAESFDWLDPIIDKPLHVEDGWAYPREGPGWGFSFKEEYLEQVIDVQL